MIFPLEHIAEAHSYYEKGYLEGKVKEANKWSFIIH